jgi:hypothetical protein
MMPRAMKPVSKDPSLPASAFAFVAAVLVGCSVGPAPVERPVAAIAPPAPPPTMAAPAPEEETLSCAGLYCTLRSITPADVAKLEALTPHDRIQLVFGEGTTDAGLATVARVPWISRIELVAASPPPDLTPITRLGSLRSLKIACARCLKNPAAIATLTGLEELVLGAALPALDVRALTPLVRLRSLTLQDMRLSGLDALTTLSALEELSVSQSTADDFGPLRKLTRVRRLNAFAVKAPEFSWLAGMSGLETALLTGSSIVDLSPLAGASRLQELSLSWTGAIQDLRPLARLTSLRSLDVEDSLVSDLSPLAGLPSLERLQIGGSRVASLAPLASIKTLRYLRADGNEISDLAPLAKLPALSQLELHHTRVQNLAPLGTLSLQFLDVGATPVTDLTPLLGSKSLSYLRVPAAVPQAQLHALKATLPSLRIDVDG